LNKLKKSDRVKLRAFLSALIRVAVSAVLFAAVAINYDRLTAIDVRAITAQSATQSAAVGAVLFVYLVKALTMVLPASVIYVAVGMSFPTLPALLINFAGICLEVTATYLLGRLLGGESVEKILKKSKGGEKLLGLKRKGKCSFVFLLRFSPLPLDLSSLFFGASRFPFGSYFFMSLLGVMPRVALLTVLGFGIYEYIPTDAVIVAALIAIPAGFIVWLAKQHLTGRKASTSQRSLPKK